MISACGARIGCRVRMGAAEIRQYETTGAPVRSDPKLGKAWACRPASKAASDSTSAAVTTPARLGHGCGSRTPIQTNPATFAG